jgi:hypothetical protein
MTSAVDYGVDCSFPVKSTELRCGNLLGDRKKVYEEYMRGCREHAGPKRASMCDRNELDRFDMSTNQPRSMVVRFLVKHFATKLFFLWLICFC